MINLKIIIFTSVLFFGMQLLTLNKSEASYHAPWYACYVEQGGTLQKCIGPFQNKYACEAKRYSLPYGTRWIGCKQ
jgi:hypothetical protein|tara:strand:- start:271 stop:498 length:228 start_codon:yes stop_codon:yes gene_type:complete